MIEPAARIDTDAGCGVGLRTDPDDCFAIALLFNSRRGHIAEISTVFGNAALSITDGTARALLRQLSSGESFAAPFAEDGDLIGFDGTHLKGRPEIASFHQLLFDKWLKGTRLVGQIKSVRFLTSDIALIHAIGGTVMPGKSEPSHERASIQTLVATKRGDRWSLSAFQNTRTRSMGWSAGGTVVWLISNWLWKVFGAKARV